MPYRGKLAALFTHAVFTLFAFPAFADVGEDWHHHGMFGEWGWHAMFLRPVAMIVWVVLLIAVVVLILKWLGVIKPHAPPPSVPREEGPLDILKRRFAEGEIDAKTYDSMKARLAKE